MTPDSPLLNRDEAAKYLRLSVRSFERNVQPALTSAGMLIRIGGKLLVKKDDLDAWLDTQRLSTFAPAAGSLTSTRPSKASGGSAMSSHAPLTGRAAIILERLERPLRKGFR